jgi:uncharacterized HAD superfamily protein
MIIAVDIDGCLSNFTDSYTRLIHEETGIQLPKASDEWPTTWYFDREAFEKAGYDKIKARMIEGHIWDRIKKNETFWVKLQPLPLAQVTVTRLNDLAREGHDIYYLTHRMGIKAKLQTERWLYNLGMNFPAVIMSGNKVPILKSIGAEIFIDDKPDTIIEVAKSIRDEKLPIRLYRKNAPYNQHPSWGDEVRSVGSVKEMLEKEGLWQ